MYPRTLGQAADHFRSPYRHHGPLVGFPTTGCVYGLYDWRRVISYLRDPPPNSLFRFMTPDVRAHLLAAYLPPPVPPYPSPDLVRLYHAGPDWEINNEDWRWHETMLSLHSYVDCDWRTVVCYGCKRRLYPKEVFCRGPPPKCEQCQLAYEHMREMELAQIRLVQQARERIWAAFSTDPDPGHDADAPQTPAGP